MTIDEYGVRHIGRAIEYVDGAEDTVLTVLSNAEDRSDGSDEIAAWISDWPTKYHFSPQRSNLVRPLRIGTGDRVLELGCGSGPITRWLGERGAQVTAIEGNLQRARAAAVRCRDLDNVDVGFGSIDELDLEESFDFVVCVGVLEYSTSTFSNAGPDGFLRTCARHLEHDGALVLAIENQLGLKYLIGYEEDHRGVPWVGIEGYSNVGARTWSRRVLGSMLAEHGLSEQRWMFPFPDYKLPVVTVAAELYEREDHVELIDSFVRQPVTADASRPTLNCDARRAHRVLLEAGLGTEVPNSFLVVASSDPGKVANATDGSLLWYFGSPRLRPWRRVRRCAETADGELVIGPIEGTTAAEKRDWLRQAPDAPRVVARGKPFDTVIHAAIAVDDLDRLAELLKLWSEAMVEADEGGLSRHPFSPSSGARALRADHIDVSVPNFVATDDGLEYIDAEWIASGAVDRSLAVTRAMWYFTLDLVTGHHRTPWGALISIDELCELLVHVAGEQPAPLDLFRASEAALQEMVTGEPRDIITEDIRRIGTVRPMDVQIPTTNALRGELAELRGMVERLGGDGLGREGVRLRDELERALDEGKRLSAELEQLESRHTDVVQELEHARQPNIGAAIAANEREQLRNEVRDARNELDLLRSTKTFRWTARMRAVYRRVRSR